MTVQLKWCFLSLETSTILLESAWLQTDLWNDYLCLCHCQEKDQPSAKASARCRSLWPHIWVFYIFIFPSSRVEPEDEEIPLDDTLVVLDKCKWMGQNGEYNVLHTLVRIRFSRSMSKPIHNWELISEEVWVSVLACRSAWPAESCTLMRILFSIFFCIWLCFRQQRPASENCSRWLEWKTIGGWRVFISASWCKSNLGCHYRQSLLWMQGKGMDKKSRGKEWVNCRLGITRWYRDSGVFRTRQFNRSSVR